MFIISSLYSLFINLYVVYDYQKGMNKTAYNFFNSNKIERIADKPVYNQTTGMTNLFLIVHLYLIMNLINVFIMIETLMEININFCVNKLGIKTIIVYKDKLKNNKSFHCKSDYLKEFLEIFFLKEKSRSISVIIKIFNKYL